MKIKHFKQLDKRLLCPIRCTLCEPNDNMFYCIQISSPSVPNSNHRVQYSWVECHRNFKWSLWENTDCCSSQKMLYRVNNLPIIKEKSKGILLSNAFIDISKRPTSQQLALFPWGDPSSETPVGRNIGVWFWSVPHIILITRPLIFNRSWRRRVRTMANRRILVSSGTFWRTEWVQHFFCGRKRMRGRQITKRGTCKGFESFKMIFFLQDREDMTSLFANGRRRSQAGEIFDFFFPFWSCSAACTNLLGIRLFGEEAKTGFGGRGFSTWQRPFSSRAYRSQRHQRNKSKLLLVHLSTPPSRLIIAS